MTKEKIEKIEESIAAARRFIKTAIDWKNRLKLDEYGIYRSMEGGACKRASLDLTRSLSRLRKEGVWP